MRAERKQKTHRVVFVKDFPELRLGDRLPQLLKDALDFNRVEFAVAGHVHALKGLPVLRKFAI